MTERNLIVRIRTTDALLLIPPFFFPLSKEYQNNVKKFYLASVESVDFANAAEESRMKINSWVESRTNGIVR